MADIHQPNTLYRKYINTYSTYCTRQIRNRRGLTYTSNTLICTAHIKVSYVTHVYCTYKRLLCNKHMHSSNTLRCTAHIHTLKTCYVAHICTRQILLNVRHIKRLLCSTHILSSITLKCTAHLHTPKDSYITHIYTRPIFSCATIYRSPNPTI